MRSLLIIFCLSLYLLILVMTPVQAALADIEAPLILVDGEAVGLIHLESEIDLLRSKLSRGKTFSLPESGEVLRRLIQNRLLEQEGYRIEADQQPLIRGQVRDFLRLKAVVALLDSISNDIAKQGYAELDSLLRVSRELRQYSHILVQDETLANSLRDSLTAGAPFANLARRYSTDGTAQSGGTLGWVGPGSFVPEFEAAVGLMTIGEVTGPVKTQYGWHLIILNDIRVETAGQTDVMREAMLTTVERENRMTAIRVFVADLKTKYDVVINTELVASLNFGSEDTVEVENLRNNNAVIFSLPGYQMTVKDLNREILFTYFHGLSGRDEASEIRDKVFNDAVDEVLLSLEARALGLDQDPVLRQKADLLERRLIREEVVNTLLRFRFKKDEDEIRAYYEADPKRFSDPVRVKLKSAVLKSKEAAMGFRERLEQGVQFRWLVDRDPGVLRDRDPLPNTWVEVDKLGVAPDSIGKGLILGPKEEEGGWLVAMVMAVEEVDIKPLDECRADVVSWMKRDRNRDVIQNALARLYEKATVEIMPDAEDRITARLLFLVGINSKTEETAKIPSGYGNGSER